MLKKLAPLALALLFGASALAAEVEPGYPLEPDRIVKSSYMLVNGTVVDNDNSGFCAQIWLRVNESARLNDKYSLYILSDAVSPSAQSVRLVRLKEKNAELINTQVEKTPENGIAAAIIIDQNALDSGELCVYFDAKYIGSGLLRANVSPVPEKSFAQDVHVNIGGYSVEKQGAGCAPVEIAAGLSGMNESSEVYIISDGEGELFRAVCSGGELLGFARRDGAIIASIEYDVANKYYINSLSRKKVLERQTVLDALAALGFSFVSAPTDELFLSNQNEYASGLTVRID